MTCPRVKLWGGGESHDMAGRPNIPWDGDISQWVVGKGEMGVQEVPSFHHCLRSLRRTALAGFGCPLAPHEPDMEDTWSHGGSAQLGEERK